MLLVTAFVFMLPLHIYSSHHPFSIFSLSATTLAWGVHEFYSAWQDAGELENVLDNLKWVTDYLIKCHPDPDTYYVQVHIHALPPSFLPSLSPLLALPSADMDSSTSPLFPSLPPSLGGQRQWRPQLLGLSRDDEYGPTLLCCRARATGRLGCHGRSRSCLGRHVPGVCAARG